MIERETDFAFLGARDYVHGTTLLSAFVDALETEAGTTLVVKRIKFPKPASSNGRLLLTTEALDAARVEAAHCSFLAAAGGTAWRGLFEQTSTAVIRRESVSYDISEVRAAAYAGTCRIGARDRDELIRVFVEANKRFHEAAAGAERPRAVRFGFLEDWRVPPRNASYAGELQATNLIAKKTEEGLMTINRLTYTDADGAPVRFTLCFHVAHEVAAAA